MSAADRDRQRTPVPTDVEAPDKIVYGLSFRQLAILGAAGTVAWLAWRGLGSLLPGPLLLALLVAWIGVAAAIALGRRDGLGLDVWLLAALRHQRAGHRLAPGEASAPVPAWAPEAAGPPPPAVLRLPAGAISPEGPIAVDDGHVGLAACSSVNVALRTEAEQAALIESYGRWLNSLSSPVQIVASAQPVELADRAAALAEAAPSLPHPALEAAAADHAAFLAELADGREPLRRTTLIACHTSGPASERDAARTAEAAARALSGLGAAARTLDGPAVAGTLATAVDPYAPPAAPTRALPATPVTATKHAHHCETCVMLPALRGVWPRKAPQPPAADTAGLPAPASVEVTGRYLGLGEGYAATFAVVGYPAEVGPAWLEPLLAWPGRADVALHIEPVPPAAAAATLRRQRARLESARRLDAVKGRLADPTTEAAAEDATELAERVARGAAHLFRLGVYVTVHARSHEELTEACTQVRAVASSLLLDLVPVTWRQMQGWCSTLPLATDSLRMRRIVDTAALAAAFPLASADLPGPLPGQPAPPGGVLYGVNTASAGIVWWDRFACDNYNAIVLARSGAGKSYQIKLETLRWLEQGATARTVDPDGEYRALAAAVGGTYLDLGAAGVRVNPFDIPPGETRRNGLALRWMFAHTVLSVLLGAPLSPEETNALDRALPAAYEAAGITHDRRTWTRPGPLLRDIAALLSHDADPAARRLAARLGPWVTGSFKDLLDGPTTLAPASHLVVWGLRHLPDEQRPIGTLLALDAIWRDIDTRTPAPNPAAAGGLPGAGRRLVVVDEAWRLLQNPQGARFLYQMAKSARKRGTGLTVVTQDIGDVLSTELGRAVVSNSATQILLRQAPQAIDAVRDAFGLTDGEARLLLAADRGEGLLLAGASRVAFRAVASPAEHRLCLTSPEFLAAGDEERADPGEQDR